MAIIEINDLCYSYSDGTEALKGISFHVEVGERVALVGPNGAGKSTLLLALGGFLKHSGSIKIDGLELNKKNIRKIRPKIGCCLQNPDDQLFMPTVFEDVAFGPLNMNLSAEQIEKRVNHALEMVGLSDMSEKPPHHLSGGQKRAASIATVLSMYPRIITLDEPDSSLDPRNRKNLIKILLKLEQTLIIATCNMSFAATVCDRAAVIDDGQLIDQGPCRDILADQNLMETHGLEVPPELLIGQNKT
jgi:cobalt/nickel transport system ATP-binding protein